MGFNKDDTSAIIGSIIIHLVLILILFFSILKAAIPNQDSGIFVNFGDFSASAGTYEPIYSQNTEQEEIQPPPTSEQETAAEEDLISQDQEETVSLPDNREEKKDENKDNREQEEEARRRQEEERRRQEEQRRQEDDINNRVNNAFGMGQSQDNRQGESPTGSGNQGNPFGNTNTGVNDGTGGFGTFNLDGRYIGSGGLPRPVYTEQEEGQIVINITVDPDGNVILAEIGRGTNIDNASMRRNAISAAKRAKFNKIQGGNNQNGTITYIYKLT